MPITIALKCHEISKRKRKKCKKELKENQHTLILLFLSNCSPNRIIGIADAKNIYVVGAKILRKPNISTTKQKMQTLNNNNSQPSD